MPNVVDNLRMPDTASIMQMVMQNRRAQKMQDMAMEKESAMRMAPVDAQASAGPPQLSLAQVGALGQGAARDMAIDRRAAGGGPPAPGQAHPMLPGVDPRLVDMLMAVPRTAGQAGY